MVADWGNSRIVFLSPSLTHIGYITVPGYQLNGSYALHLDQLNHVLFIGEWILGGHVFKFDLNLED